VILGLLPEIRGGLGTLAQIGQHTRFIDGYLRPYARAFDEVRYFSYRRETLADFTDDRELTARTRVIPGPPWHPWLSTTLMGLRHGRALAGCSVLRVFHLTGVVPALVARRRFGVPFAMTYGFHYDRLARTAARAWMHRRLERLALAEADAVIVTTPELAAYVAGRERATRVVAVVADAYYREAGKGKREAWRPVMDVIERAAPGLVELVGAPGRPGFEIRLAQREFPKAYEADLKRAVEAALAGGGKRETVDVTPVRPTLVSRLFAAVKRMFTASA